MREVHIVGIGQTKVGEHWERSLRDLGVDAISAALKDANVEHVDALYVGNMLSGELAAQQHLGTLLADWAGLGNIEAVKVEAADASGAAAVRMGYLAVASGMQDLVLVCGVEKTTDADAETANAAWSSGTDAEYEASQGLSMPAIAGLLMRRYMHEFGVQREDFAPLAVNAHANGANNPYAMFRRPISAKAYARAGMVADPISMFDAAPLCDGAAAVVLCPGERASEFATKSVRIRASSMATDRLALHSRRDPLFLPAAHLSAQKAYLQAGVGPGDIDLFELHDAFTVMAALSLEACGFAERGKAVQLAQEGEISLQGRIPICTMGGLKARGHPIGATGVYQIVELVTQLRAEAGANQIDCHLGMAQSIGGSGATAVTHILEA
ncbi:MAG: acetyl-CoA acetyltransferase [Anaerolineae bacterium SM23_84]|nr:MAG: acetyl-CoA acetyltransferase [Anaerolineae bacterium SM23_84]